MKKLVADLAEKAFFGIIDGLSIIGDGLCAIMDAMVGNGKRCPKKPRGLK